MNNMELFEKGLSQTEILPDESHGILNKISTLLECQEDALLSIFAFYQDNGQIAWTHPELSSLSFEKTGGDILLRADSSEVLLSKKVFFFCLSLLSDIFLPLLPLGSLVRLKDGALKKAIDLQENYTSDVVIVDRYVAVPEAGIYFPYSGVIYPIGTFGTERKIYFGPQLIEQVVFLGYADEREESFHQLVKEEYILEKELHSMSFSSSQEEETLRNMLEDITKKRNEK